MCMWSFWIDCEGAKWIFSQFPERSLHTFLCIYIVKLVHTFKIQQFEKQKNDFDLIHIYVEPCTMNDTHNFSMYETCKFLPK